MSPITRARALLSARGVAAYEPGAHPGRCTAAYTVLRQSGLYPTPQARRLRYTLMTVHCYVPLGQDATQRLDALCAAVKGALTPLHSQARPTGREGSDTIEEAYHALSRTIEYQVLRAPKEE